MKKIASIILVLAVAMSMAFGAYAYTKDEAKEIAQSVINTKTDPSLVTSPFIGVIGQIQPSVVGVNNYQIYTYSSYNPYYGFGGFGGFGFGGFGGYDSYGGSTESAEKLTATGSGVVVYNEIVLTNYHVVEDASRVSVSILNTEEELNGTVVAYDAAADIAVVHIPGLTLNPVPLGDSDQLQVGEWAICIGNPLAEELQGTVTAGIISALDRQIDSTTTTDKYGLKRTVTNSMIQTDAAINSGNSGGGMFNVLGQLMGIPSAKYSGSYYSGTTVEGIGLAIPINTAKPLIEEAIVKILTNQTASAAVPNNGNTAGNKRPMLGITFRVISSSNDPLVYSGLLPTGIRVSEVSEGSPAEAAGILPDDIIVEVAGDIVTSTNSVSGALDKCTVGDTISIKVYRVKDMNAAYSTGQVEGEYIDLEVELFAFNVSA